MSGETVLLLSQTVTCEPCGTRFGILIPSDAEGQDFVQCPNPGCGTMLTLRYPFPATDTPHVARAAEPGFQVLIYVSGPYSADTDRDMLANTHWALGAGAAIFRLGHSPVIPHLYHFFDQWVRESPARYRPTYEQYMALDLMLVEKCDGFLLLGRSPGALRELDVARRCHLPIWTDPLTIPRASS